MKTRNTQARLTNWLAEQGVRIPRIHCSTNSGEHVVEHGEHRWCLLDYVDGEYFSGEGQEFAEAGMTLQNLFLELRRAPEHLQVEQAIEPPAHRALETISMMERDRNSWPEIFGEEHAALLNQSWQCIKADLSSVVDIGPMLKSSVRLCHIDLHPHNLLTANGKTVAVLDFASLLKAPLESMICFNLFKLARQSLAVRGGEDQGAYVRAQRDSILTEFDASGLIRRRPHSLLALFAKAEIMRRLLYILNLNCEKENKQWNHVLPVQISALQEADVIFS